MAILSEPKEKASCAEYPVSPGLCWITTHPLPPSEGSPTGLATVFKINAFEGLFKSVTLVA